MCRRSSSLLAVGLAGFLLPAADVKKGVGLDKISLPSGPGSIEGLGDAFEPQLNTGTSAYSVRIAIPPGVNGLQPSVVLRYNAGAGNGPFGLAWGWAPMSIQRQVEKGLPTYGASDTFTFEGEELVSLSDGTYRVENESAFMRIRLLGDGWEIHDKSGTQYILGTNASARVARSRRGDEALESSSSVPGDGAGSQSLLTSSPTGEAGDFSRTFRWLVESVTDVHGNRMEYRYATYTDSPGEIYCTEIRYSISAAGFHSVHFDYEPRPDAFSSFLSGFEIRAARRCREVAVRSQGRLIRRYALSYTPDPLDPVESVPAGDVEQLFSLLRKVTQYDNREGSDAAYLPPLRFGYTRMDGTLATVGRLTGTPPYSLGNPQLALADINCDGLPDLFYTDPDSGQHTVFHNLGRGAFGPATDFVAYPGVVGLGSDNVQIADLDGDGRADLVQKFGGAEGGFGYFPNRTRLLDNDDARPAWGDEVSFTPPFPPFELADPAVRSLDLDNDKRMDFMRTTPFGFEYYVNRTNRWEVLGLQLFGEPGLDDLSSADGVEFSTAGETGDEVSNGAVKLADLNGDRLLDLVRISEFDTFLEVTYWPNRGAGQWGGRVTMSGTVDLRTLPIEDVQLRDLNGDGLADVVLVGFDSVAFWINRGNGSWSTEFRREGTPTYIRGETVLQQADINGNGSTDILWENFNRTTGQYEVDYVDFLGATKPNLLQTIDNGIGLRTEIAYKSTTEDYLADRDAGVPWRTRLPFPSVVVGRITKRLGLDLDAHPGLDEYVSEIFYHDGYYDDREKEFRGFAFARKVERGDDRYSGADAVPVHSPGTVSRFGFHTGVPDGVDNNDNSQTDELQGRSGYEEEPLKGKVLWTEVTLLTADVGGTYPAQTNGLPANDAVVFTRETNSWRIKTIHGPTNGFKYRDAFGVEQPSLSLAATATDGRRVAFAFPAATRKEVIEANGALAASDPMIPVRSKRVIDSESDVDFFGNTIRDQDYGEDSPGSTYDDERFTYSTYAFNLEAWIIGLPARMLVTDERGQFVAESRNYYDGTPFTGLPLGEVGSRGLMHREEHLVNGAVLPPAFDTISKAVGDPRLGANYAITTSRAQYDEFGNLQLVRDPLYDGPGSGHEKEYAYDAVFHTYVERETIRVGNGSADLVASATYDRGAGVMTGFTDFNGNSTSFQYDSFWRLVGIVKPGDSEQFPTAQFSYRPGDPFRGLYFNYDATGNLTLVNTAEPEVVNAVTTRQRETAGEAGTFDTVSFTDGGGHKLGTLHEDSAPGQWVAKDFKRYSSQGEERKAFLPFVKPSPAYAIPEETQTHVASFYDPVSRVVRTVNPPESDAAEAALTQTRSIYLPLEIHLFDEEDLNPGSPYHNTPHFQFTDGLGRLVGVVEVTRLKDDGMPGTGTNHWLTTYEYDLNDNLTHITDSQNNQKWFRYDGLKRKLFMNDPDRGVMEYAYDDASNLRSTLDAKAQRITFTYDGVNRLQTEKYHDGLPLPPYRRSSRGHETPFSPDQSGGRSHSLLASSPPSVGRSRGDETQTASVIYHYDTPDPDVPVGDGTAATARNTRGMLAWVEDLSGEEHTSYDARGRVESVIKRLPDPEFLSTGSPGAASRLVSYRTGFNYDSLDRVTTLTYPDSDQVGYRYNARNLLEQITGGPGGNIISGIAYRPSDQLAQTDYGNGVQTTYDYDPRLRLRRLRTRHPELGREYIHFTYEFDGVSNIESIRDRRPGSEVPAGDPRRNTQIFEYDDLYRITRAGYSFALPDQPDANNGFITYRYDRIGNMLEQSSDIVHIKEGLSVTDLGEMSSGGTAGRFNRRGRAANDPPGPHALTSIARPSPLAPRLYPYDSNGNMTVIDGLTNTWDFKDRLIAVESAEMRAEYTYDYTDRRVLKRVFPKSSQIPDPRPHTPLSVLYPDKHFEVREHDAPVKYVWNGNTRVARVTGSLTTNLRTQRLRLWPGMNLVSLAVDVVADDVRRLHLSDPSLFTSPASIESLHRWNSATLSWLPPAANEPLPAGTVLWLRVSTNTTLSLTATHSEPTNQNLAAGPNFVGGWGLQPLALSKALPAEVVAWNYDASAQRWLRRLTCDLLPQSDASLMLAAGTAAMARPEAVSTLIVPESASQMRYYHQDHLGSSSALTDAAGALVSETANYAFGFARKEFLPRNDRESYGFTQKEGDGESGLAYFEARYLVSTIARFSSIDPAKTSSFSAAMLQTADLNCYAYCRNRPMSFTDGDGCSENSINTLINDFAATDSKYSAFLQYANKPAEAGNRRYYSSVTSYGIRSTENQARAGVLAANLNAEQVVASYHDDTTLGRSTVLQALRVGWKQFGFGPPSGDWDQYEDAYIETLNVFSGGGAEYRSLRGRNIMVGQLNSYGSTVGGRGGRTQLLGTLTHGRDLGGLAIDFAVGLVPRLIQMPSDGDNRGDWNTRYTAPTVGAAFEWKF